MKNFFFLTLSFFCFSTWAGTSFLGQVRYARGSIYELQNQKCKVEVLVQDENQITLRLTAGDNNEFDETRTVQKGHQGGLESLAYNFSFLGPVTPVASTAIVQQEHLLATLKSPDDFRIKTFKYEWSPGTFYFAQPYTLNCEAQHN